LLAALGVMTRSFSPNAGPLAHSDDPFATAMQNMVVEKV
jgi:hypothetical protein